MNRRFKLKTKLLVVVLCISVLLGSNVFGRKTEESIQNVKNISRLECLTDIVQCVLNEKQMQCPVIHFYVPPFCDIYGNEIVNFAYSQNIAYGSFLNQKDAETLTSKENEKLEEMRKEYYRENPSASVLTSDVTGLTYDSDTAFFVDKNGNSYTPFLFSQAKYEEGRYFFPNTTTKISECVAFMVRCINKDDSFKDLNVSWDYACEVDLLLSSDLFYLTPDGGLTQDTFSILLSRFEKGIEDGTYAIVV